MTILFDSRGESLTYGLPNLEGDHIATFDPPTALALVAEVRELRAKVERVGLFTSRCSSPSTSAQASASWRSAPNAAPVPAIGIRGPVRPRVRSGRKHEQHTSRDAYCAWK